MGYSRKKNRGGDMEFPSRVIVLKKQNVVFGTYIHPNKKSGISRGVQDRAIRGGISMDLGF